MEIKLEKPPLTPAGKRALEAALVFIQEGDNPFVFLEKSGVPQLADHLRELGQAYPEIVSELVS